jgi:hypothetical protein
VLLAAFTSVMAAQTAPLAGTASGIEVLPKDSVLSTKESKQQLIAQVNLGQFQQDATKTAQWTSSNEAVAKVDASGMVTPVSDGAAEIKATINGITSASKITVTGQTMPFYWSFSNHVIPALTKAGCNQGACHGALAGKNGFKLTLRGYDPEVDFYTLTRQATARRISLAEPTNSLLLKKGAFEIPHAGGKRFTRDSLEYRVIAEWIADGTKPPTAQDPEVSRLEVYPANVILKPNVEQQLVVRAVYSDGRMEDVTRWVKYGSNNEGVAMVNDFGSVKTIGSGEAAITLWYNNKVLYARIAVPYEFEVDPKVYTSFTRQNFIDGLVIKKLEALKLQPSKLSSDSEFIRRAYLDATGSLPTSENVEQFLADKSADKRAKLVETLLASEEFNDQWAYKFSDLFLVSTRKLPRQQMMTFYNWIRDSVKQNKGWDTMARDIFEGSGSARQNGALNYFVIHKDTIDLAENTTQAFLGQRLTCARCHNHPLEKWTQKQYYQFANLFARVAFKNGDMGETVVYAKANGDINHPRLLRPMEPTPLDGKAMSLDDLSDRRKHFANWLTDKNNSYFARNIVNRVWGHYMGRGLSHPVDDVRATNPASNEELFVALEKDFTSNGFDLRRLMRTIMNSTTYQLSSESNATNQRDDMFYSRYIIKRLPAETLLDSMSQVTGASSSFAGFPMGTKAVQLPDVRVQSQFLDVFGRPARIICDAGERSMDPSIAQALHVINGDTLNKKLMSENGSISLMTKLGLSDGKILDQLFLSAVSRYPTEDEKSRLMPLLAKSREAKGSTEVQREARRQALEDMSWALLTSKEFLFNH